MKHRVHPWCCHLSCVCVTDHLFSSQVLITVTSVPLVENHYFEFFLVFDCSYYLKYGIQHSQKYKFELQASIGHINVISKTSIQRFQRSWSLKRVPWNSKNYAVCDFQSFIKRPFWRVVTWYEQSILEKRKTRHRCNFRSKYVLVQ